MQWLRSDVQFGCFSPPLSHVSQEEPRRSCSYCLQTIHVDLADRIIITDELVRWRWPRWRRSCERQTQLESGK